MKHPRLLRAALAVGAVLAFHARTVFGGRVFVERDVLRTLAALYGYWAQRIRAGHFPEWFPYDGLGQPFAGLTVAGVFHPIHLLWLILPPQTALTWATLACSAAALAGAYGLARSLGLPPVPAAVCGVGFAFCGYMVGITNNTEYLLAAATAPACLWAAGEAAAQGGLARVARTALLLVLVLFAGDPQGFVVTAACCLPLALYRAARGHRWNAMAWLGASFGAAAVVGAVQLYASWSAGQGRRMVGPDEAQRWSLHPLQALELVVGPLFMADAGSDAGKSLCRDLLDSGMSTLWVGSLCAGALVVALALAALCFERRHRAAGYLGAATLVLLLAALGRYGGVYRVLHALPGWNVFRYPVKLVPWLCLALALAAGAGLWATERSEGRRRRLAWALFAAAGTCAAVTLWLVVSGGALGALLAPLWPRPPPAALAIFRNHAAVAFGTSAVALALGGSVARWVPQRPRGPAWVALVFISLVVANARSVGTAPAALLDAPPPPLLARILRDEGGARLGGYRVLRVTGKFVPRRPDEDPATHLAEATLHALEPDVSALWGVETANTYLPANPAAYSDLTSDDFDFALNAAPVFGTRYAIASAAQAPELAQSWDTLEQDPAWGLTLFRARADVPRAHLARARCVPDALTARVMMRRPGFDVRNEVLVECHTPPTEDAPITGGVEVLGDAPEEVDLVSTADRPAWLVWGDAYAAGWTALLDGVPVPIALANGSTRAVEVPAGRHEVRLEYRAPGLRPLGALSAAACLALLALSVFGRRGRVA